MLALQAEEGEGSRNPSEPQPPPSTAQPTHEEPIPNIESSSPQKTQSPRQALNKDTELPQTSMLIPNDSSNIAKTQSTTTPTELISQETSSDGDPMRQETMGVPLFKLDMTLALETDLRQTKKVYGTAYTKLIMKVNKLEKTIKTSQARRSAKIVVTDDDMTSEDSSKLGRMMEEIDQDAGVTLVTPTKVTRVHTYSRRRRTVSTGSGGVSTATRIVCTTGMIQQVNIIIPSSSATKDKGKAIMTEYKLEKTSTKLKQRQERAGYEAAIRLQEQLDQEESQRITKDAEVAQRLQEEIDAAE
ncbi:hypothetical protein Tco_1386329 [Tanacetum coccineum]